MPGAPERGSDRGCWAAASREAVEANRQPAVLASGKTDEASWSLWMCWSFKQRWVSCGPFWPPPCVLSCCLHAQFLASYSVPNGHGHPLQPPRCLRPSCMPSCRACKCLWSGGLVAPLAGCLMAADRKGRPPCSAHGQATWDPAGSGERDPSTRENVNVGYMVPGYASGSACERCWVGVPGAWRFSMSHSLRMHAWQTRTLCEEAVFPHLLV